MKNKIKRAKQFAQKHSHTLIYATGVGMGGWFVYSTMSSLTMPRHIDVHMNATPDRLKQLIDECDGRPLLVCDHAANVSVKLFTKEVLES